VRKSETVEIETEGRDKGKRFIITELPALQAEKWAMRALLALARSGADLPNISENGGMGELALVGFQALGSVAWEDLEPLMDEMFQCVKIAEPALPAGRNLTPDDIEEIPTRLKLRMEVFRLHASFFQTGAPSTSAPVTRPQAATSRPRTSRVR